MLKRLEINNLFGFKEIDVKFDNKITLLIGRNGSGKTTILNILNSIISGEFYFLTEYKFDDLKLTYLKDGKEKEIHIKFIDFNKFNINWSGNNKQIDLEDLEKAIFSRSKLGYVGRNFEERMSSIQDFFNLISEDFNKIYLPLSRNTGENVPDEQIDFFYRSNNTIAKSDVKITNLDQTLDMVDQLVSQKQHDIMLEFDDLNKQMQMDLFRSSFTFDQSPNIFIADFEEVNNMLKSKNELKRAFEELNMLNEDFNNKIDTFYRKLETVSAKYKKWYEEKSELEGNSEEIFSFIKNSSQISRIVKWKEIVITRNKRKSKINKPLEIFFNTLNEYLGDSGKKLDFDNEKKRLLFYHSEGDSVTTNFLSSGEKHILIFFAYLIFGIEKDKKGIFIVDEPELSLHLKWQEKFSEDLLKIAPNLQVIFATHSPEIVGNHRENIRVLGGDHA